MEDVQTQSIDGALWIRLQRPERRNAYDIDMARAVIGAVEGAADHYAVVITGSDRAFCAGGALNQLDDQEPALLRELLTTSMRMLQAIRACPRPVIAAVNGGAAGGGNELVIACDFALAARSATFGQTGPRVGSSPVLGATNLMSVQIGEKRAKEMTMLCRRYSAEQALELGLVNEVVEDDALEARVTEWVQELKQLSPRYLEVTKISSNIWWNLAQDSMGTGLGMLLQAIGSEDMQEGARAFLEKRRPRFAAPGPPATKEAT